MPGPVLYCTVLYSVPVLARDELFLLCVEPRCLDLYCTVLYSVPVLTRDELFLLCVEPRCLDLYCTVLCSCSSTGSAVPAVCGAPVPGPVLLPAAGACPQCACALPSLAPHCRALAHSGHLHAPQGSSSSSGIIFIENCSYTLTIQCFFSPIRPKCNQILEKLC